MTDAEVIAELDNSTGWETLTGCATCERMKIPGSTDTRRISCVTCGTGELLCTEHNGTFHRIHVMAPEANWSCELCGGHTLTVERIAFITKGEHA